MRSNRGGFGFLMGALLMSSAMLFLGANYWGSYGGGAGVVVEEIRVDGADATLTTDSLNWNVDGDIRTTAGLQVGTTLDVDGALNTTGTATFAGLLNATTATLGASDNTVIGDNIETTGAVTASGAGTFATLATSAGDIESGEDITAAGEIRTSGSLRFAYGTSPYPADPTTATLVFDTDVATTWGLGAAMLYDGSSWLKIPLMP